MLTISGAASFKLRNSNLEQNFTKSIITFNITNEVLARIFDTYGT